VEGEIEGVVDAEVWDALGLVLAPSEEENDGVRETLGEGETLGVGVFQFEMLASASPFFIGA